MNEWLQYPFKGSLHFQVFEPTTHEEPAAKRHKGLRCEFHISLCPVAPHDNDDNNITVAVDVRNERGDVMIPPASFTSSREKLRQATAAAEAAGKDPSLQLYRIFFPKGSPAATELATCEQDATIVLYIEDKELMM